MDILRNTIKQLSKEEIINYKLYANRTQSNANRKDILLFDLLRKQVADSNDDTKIVQKLYPGSENKNMYYRLKNRLLNEVNNSLVQFYCYNNDSHDIYGELSLYKVFLKKNDWQLANYHLLKAEKKAALIQDFSLLDVIYTEHINLSIRFGETSPEVFVRKREENYKRLKDIRTLDDALANLIFQLKRTQNFSRTGNKTSAILNKTILTLNAKKEFRNNLVFKIKLYNAISRLLLSQQDYISLEAYTLKTYHEFSRQGLFSRVNHEVKLQMLSYLCNTLFVNKKHAQSLDYLKLLHEAMKEYKAALYDNYVFFYYNSLVNNYTVLDPEKAIAVLNEAKENKVIKHHPTHLGYIYLNLAGAYFDLKQHKTALKHIIKLYNHKLFESIDQSFKVKICITEIILRIETGDFEYALKLIDGLLKTNSSLFLHKEYGQDADFLRLLIQLIKKHDFKKSSYSTPLIRAFFRKTYASGSLNIVNYNTWLSEKLNLSA